MRKIKLPGIVFCCLTILLTTNICYSQNLIAVQHANNHSFYTTLDSAITQAQNGDTIYIPGGVFSISTPISKQLSIVGVGHNPDSTIATLPSYIIGDIVLKNGCNRGSISGIFLKGAITYFNGNDTIQNFFISRCHLIPTSTACGLCLPNYFSNGLITENIIEGSSSIYSPGIQLITNNSFRNNIIYNTVQNLGANNFFENNIFLGQSYTLYSNRSCIFENNVFLSVSNTSGGSWETTNSIFNNNIFVENWAGCTGCLLSNNIINQQQNSIFINQTGNLFNYTENYHLKITCPGKNAGTDGTDIGIHGGQFPWKEGSVPFNPHVQFKNISGSTTPNGNLPINIKVAAQDH